MTSRDKPVNNAELKRQIEAAEQSMDRYRHALRALATGETVEESREEMAREDRERADERS